MMEERLSALEAQSATTTARLATMEIKMNDRFQDVEDQIAELRRSKAGVELQVEMNRRFAEQREYMDQRFAKVDMRFERVDSGLEEARRRGDQTDNRLDRIESEMREVVRETRSFVRGVVSGQIGIALAILVMASKTYFG